MDDPARSVDTLKQRTHEPETQIASIMTDMKAADNREKRPLLMSELQKALYRMDDLKQQQELDDVGPAAAPFFLF
jgi:hypothetical protein